MNNGQDGQAKQQGFEKLFSIIMEEISAYDYLAETLADKQKAIVNNHLDRIESLSGTEQLIIKKANGLTATRLDILRQIFIDNKKDNLPVTMSNFIKYFDGAANSPWAKINLRLQTAIMRIQRLNAENRELLRASISYVHQMIQLLYPVDAHAANVYNRDGVANQRMTAKSLLDCNV